MSHLSLLISTLVFSLFLVFLFVKLGLGSVLGFLVTGILIGPDGLAILKDSHDIHYLAEFGIIFLLFLIGIETKPRRLWVLRRTILSFGLSQFFLTGLALSGLIYAFLGFSPEIALIVGFATALSSTAMGFQILVERKILKTPSGQASFSTLLFQDAAVIPFLALMPLLTGTDMPQETPLLLAFSKNLLILFLFIGTLKLVIDPVFRLISRTARSELFNITSLLLVLGSAFLLSRAGLSMSLGAFIAGVMIGNSAFRHQVVSDIEPFKNLLLGLFFITVGMTLDLDMLHEKADLVLTATAGLMAVKALLLLAIGLMNRLNFRAAMQYGLLLAQGGEFGFVVFSLAERNALFTPEETTFFSLIIAVSMLATPLFFRLFTLIADRRPQKTKNTSSPPSPPEEDDHEPEVALIGFGHLGYMLAEMLSSAGVKYVALENNIPLVREARESGYNVYYGNVINPNFLNAASIESVRAVVVTTHDFETTSAITEFLSKKMPDVPLLVRTRYLTEAEILKGTGNAHIIVEELNSVCTVGENILKLLAFPATHRQRTVKRFESTIFRRLGFVPMDRTSAGRGPATSTKRRRGKRPSLRNARILRRRTGRKRG